MSAKSPLTAVVDVGSNSVRMVVFSGKGRWQIPVFNERTLCGLGRDLPQTKKLSTDGVPIALNHLKRFAEIGHAMGVGQWHVLATEAIRVAEDGKAFADQAEKCIGAPLRLLDGDEEGEISALGVISGIPEADGLMGDLGGGSLEIVAINKGKPGKRASLPFGSLRFLAKDPESGGVDSAFIDQALNKIGWLEDIRDRTFYPVGGAWRAFANIQMGQIDYPLHIIHQYEMSRRNALETLRLVGGLGLETLRRIPGVPKARLSTLPTAAKIMERLLLCTKPRNLVFSAYGLREGWVFSGLKQKERATDPLIAACRQYGRRESRFRLNSAPLTRWMDPLFPKEDKPARRLRQAAAALSDLAWSDHPDYRAEGAFNRILHLPVPAIDHEERVRLAFMVGARYGAGQRGFAQDRVRPLITDEALDHALKVGRALRVGLAISGGAKGLLERSSIKLNGKSLTMTLPAEGKYFLGDAAARQFSSLASQFGCEAVIKCRKPAD